MTQPAILLSFASLVDRDISLRHGRARSSFGCTQKVIADQMIQDHYTAGSSVAETAAIIWQSMKTLEA